MLMPPWLRRFTFTAHVTTSVGWLGAIAAYLAPAVAGLASEDTAVVRASYIAMGLIIRFVVLPFSIAALATGLAQSLATEWGLFRHYWIATKFVLTVAATVVLLLHIRTVNFVSQFASGSTFSVAELGLARAQLVLHAVGGLVVLLVATTLSVYKPWGRTPYGLRVRDDVAAVAVRPVALRRYFLVVLVALAVIVAALHIAGGGLPHH